MVGLRDADRSVMSCVADSQSNPMRALHYLELAQRLGLDWVAYRGVYAVRRKTGLLKRRFPTREWDRVTLAGLVNCGVPTEPEAYKAYRATKGGKFLFASGCLPAATELERIIGADATALIAHPRRSRSRRARSLRWPSAPRSAPQASRH